MNDGIVHHLVSTIKLSFKSILSPTQRGIGLTPLMLACLHGHTTVVQLLIEAKVNVNQLSRVSSFILVLLILMDYF